MHMHRPNLRSIAVTATVLGLTASGVAITASPASAVSAPSSPTSEVRNSSTVILSWAAVRNADAYEVQVDSSSSFSSPDYTAKTVNVRVVPSKNLIPGENFWRVRAVDGSERSAWSEGAFDIAPVTVPVVLAPADGLELDQPDRPPLLQWTPSQGATSYTVLVDADSDMIGAKSYTTKTTSLVLPDPLTVGDWFWSVTASKGSGLVSLPSDVSSFLINPIALPTLTSPDDSVTTAIEDVTLDWEPVPGARSYDLQIATDDGFNNITHEAEGIFGTRYSPKVTVHNDQFFWRVRAVDLAGQQTPWTESRFAFQRQWLDKPSYVYPQGTEASPGAINTSRQFYEWTPVQHATYYELYTASDPFFNTNVDVCKTAGTTYAPRSAGDCGYKSSGTTYWAVRPMDKPYPGDGVPGTISAADTRAFVWTDPGADGGTFVIGSVPDNLEVSVSGVALGDTSKACRTTFCDNVPATPVFAWDPVPGATSYRVWVALDENFTFKAMGNTSYLATSNTMAALCYDCSDNVPTLEESTAGSAYYWYVQACGPGGCGLSPVSQDPPLPGVKSFRKKSPQITGLDASNLAGTDITFAWDDYITNNDVVDLWRSQRGTQSARTYYVQVDNDPSFASPIDTANVDQTTYTAYDKLYPEGTYFWRVQARDADDNGLTWSDVKSFVKQTPAVTLSSPVDNVLVPGTHPFRWDPQAFAASYTIEVYKNNDLTFSVANRLFSANAKVPAYTPASPVPASDQPYVWRVRRIDTDGNPGPWSATGTFRSSGEAANLLSPPASSWVPTKTSFFEWSEVPGAASYSLNVSGTKTAKFSTVATAYAYSSGWPTGAYSWNVTAYDGAGKALSVSATRQFSVDATAPTVKRVGPSPLRAGSTLKIAFSERVQGVSNTSMKLFRLNGTKKIRIKAKVKVLNAGKNAALDPIGSLKPGSYLLVFVANRIKDLHGNFLAATEIKLKR